MKNKSKQKKGKVYEPKQKDATDAETTIESVKARDGIIARIKALGTTFTPHDPTKKADPEKKVKEKTLVESVTNFKELTASDRLDIEASKTEISEKYRLILMGLVEEGIEEVFSRKTKPAHEVADGNGEEDGKDGGEDRRTKGEGESVADRRSVQEGESFPGGEESVSKEEGEDQRDEEEHVESAEET